LFILGRPRAGQEVCFCFDAATGKRLWRVPYASPYHPPAGCGPDNGPNSTPAVDGDRVYMLGLGGMFHCLDVKTGRVLWKHDFASEYWGVERDEAGEDRWFPPCGTAASPLVVGNLVVAPVGGRKAGAFAAFDRQTGARAWKVLKDHLIGVSHASRSLVCVDLATGATTWQSPRFADYASLVVAGDLLLALSNRGELLVAKADTTKYTPVGTWKVSEAGGTWAHP